MREDICEWNGNMYICLFVCGRRNVHECLKCGGNIQGSMSANASVLRSVCEEGIKMNNAMFTFVEYNELKCCLLLNIIIRRRASDHPPFLPLVWGLCVRA